MAAAVSARHGGRGRAGVGVASGSALNIVVGPDIKPAARGEATVCLHGAATGQFGRRAARAAITEGSGLARLLVLTLLVVVLGGVAFRATWDSPAPTVEIETVVPDDRLPR